MQRSSTFHLWLATLSLFVALLPQSASGQLDSVYHEVHYSDDGTVQGYPAGHTTYRIYGALSNDQSQVLSVFGVLEPPQVIARLGCVDGEMYNINTSGSSPISGTQLDISQADNFPNIPYDSFITVGIADDSQQGTVSFAAVDANFSEALGTPGQGPDLVIEDGVWFSPQLSNPNVFGEGPNHRVLLAQLTCPTDLHYRLNIQVLDAPEDAQNLLFVNDYSEAVANQDEYDGVFFDPTLNYPRIDVPGCMDETACNYNPFATVDDGNCLAASCTDPAACNYNGDLVICSHPDACIYQQEPVVNATLNQWKLVAPAGTIESPDYLPIIQRTNWYFNEDGSADHNLGLAVDFEWSLCQSRFALSQVGEVTTYFSWVPEHRFFMSSPSGFILAEHLPGCDDENACNYDPSNTTPGANSSCVYAGCTYPDATNYNANAGCDDGSCAFGEASCPTDLDDDGETGTSDLLEVLGQFGSACD